MKAFFHRILAALGLAHRTPPSPAVQRTPPSKPPQPQGAGTGAHPGPQPEPVVQAPPPSDPPPPPPPAPPPPPQQGEVHRGTNVNIGAPDAIELLDKLVSAGATRFRGWLPFRPKQGTYKDQLHGVVAAAKAFLAHVAQYPNVSVVLACDSFPKADGSWWDIKSADFSTNGQADVAACVHTLVAAFVGHGPELMGFDFWAEPVTEPGNQVPAGYAQMQQTICDTISALDPLATIIIHAAPWGGAPSYVNMALPTTTNPVMASFHFYAPRKNGTQPDYTHQGIGGNPWPEPFPGPILPQQTQALVDWLKVHPMPVWVGEFSAVVDAPDGEQWCATRAAAFEQLFKQYGLVSLYFDVGGWQGWDPRHDSQHQSENPLPGWDAPRAKWLLGWLGGA